MIRPLTALAALATLACGAPAPEWPADAAARSWSIPLVMAWRPERALVEVAIDGSAPLLMAVDTTRAIGTLLPDVAARLGLPRAGDPTRGARVMAETVRIGEVALRRVPFSVESGAHGELFGRPVVGALGWDWFAGRTLEYDRDAGLLRVLAADEPERAQGTVGVEREGPRWRLPVELAGVRIEPALATAAPAGVLPERAARAVAEAIDEAGGDPAIPAVIGGVAAHPGPWRVGGGAGEGRLSLTDLGGLSWRLDTAARRFTVWRAAGDAARFARFGPLPDCGADFAECLSGRVAAVAPGRAELAFDPPARFVPERYWFRVDLGPPGRPYWALVQLRPRPPGVDGPLTATIEASAVRPERLRAVGEPVDVVDLVPGDRPCGGVICLYRQEGDAAELIVESSDPDAAPGPMPGEVE